MNNGYAIALNEWIFDTKIKTELPLLLYISSLTALEGYAYAGNEHLAEKFNTTSVTISRKLAKLEKLGYIEMEYIKRGTQVVSRIIRLTKMLTDGYQKCKRTVNKNVKENSTSNNNTSNNKGKAPTFTPPSYEEVLEFAKQRNKVEIAKKFFDYFDVGKWIDAKGNKVKNWKQKFITWENRNNETSNPNQKNNQPQVRWLGSNE